MSGDDNILMDVSQYSNEELYQIMDLNNPTDRELEARIIFMINKYKNLNQMENAMFFNKIYSHFFESSDDDDDDDQTQSPNQTQNQNQNQSPNQNHIREGFEQVVDKDIQNETTGEVTRANINQYQSTPEKLNISKEQNERIGSTITGEAKNINITKQLDLTSGNVNPLLLQTLRRVISIDSQYRSANYTLSSEFTFNLSEPLKDVVSMKLYSISIPYTWYTVNNNFGSNFLILQGNSPGINDGNYDFNISIETGNYTADGLIAAINTSLQTAISGVSDVSFGSTKLKYDDPSSSSTFDIYIEKNFSERSYTLNFPYWTTPNSNEPNDPLDPGSRFLSIPGFLGLNHQTYYLNVARSARTFPISTSTQAIASDAITTFTISDTNKTLILHKYSGPGPYNPSTSIVEATYQITLNASNAISSYSRNQLITILNDTLQEQTFLSSTSEIRRIDISNNTTVDPPDNVVLNNGQSYFELSLQFNRDTTENTTYSKAYLIFPDETSLPSQQRIWTISGSCFNFKRREYEMSEVIGETPIIRQEDENIIVENSPYIEIKCINPYGYGNNISQTQYDTSFNDYLVNIPNSSTTGYLLSELINAFNVGLNTTQLGSVTTNNPQGEIIKENSKFVLNNDATVSFQLDINKTFNNNDYVADTSNNTYGQSFLTSVLKIQDASGGLMSDLSTNNVYTSTFTTASSYFIDNSFVLNVEPTSQGNIKADPFVLNVVDMLPIVISEDLSFHTFPPGGISVNNAITDLPLIFNYLFSNFQDDEGDFVLSGSELSIQNDGVQGELTAILTLSVQKNLTEHDFSIQFIDPSYNNQVPPIDISDTLYVSNLEFDPQYITQATDLSTLSIAGTTYSGAVLSTQPITVNSIIINNTNNTFYFEPFETGVTASNNANRITITLDNGDYNRNELIEEINSKLTGNTNTQNTYFEIITDSQTNEEFIKIRGTLLKQYTAKDYKLVFYSEESFVSCYASVSSARSTTFDATLGWLLGFRERTTYELSDSTILNYTDNSTVTTNGSIVIKGDSTVTVDLYSKLFIVIDDYNQNRLNDGLITNVSDEEVPTLPSYALRNSLLCDPGSQTSRINSEQTERNTYNRLTEKQLYAINAISIDKDSQRFQSNKGLGPSAKDVFAVIPIKVSSLKSGDVYTEFGGTLQTQERVYFGPVNIKRMSVKLISDRGDVIDLNGSDWTFSLVAEQLYQSSTD